MEGLDCWGFLKLVYKDVGFELFDIENLEYDKAWALRRQDYFRKNYPNNWDRVNTPRVMDGLLFLNKKGIANHAGVMLTNWRFIHASRAGVIVSRLTDIIWQRRIEGFYRLKKKTW